MTLDDLKLECEIWAAQAEMTAAKSREARSAWYQRLLALVEMRRPQFVADLERMKGLRA